MYPSDHYFDTSQVPPGGRVPQVGNPWFKGLKKIFLGFPLKVMM